jgi:hypothetical protein
MHSELCMHGTLAARLYHYHYARTPIRILRSSLSSRPAATVPGNPLCLHPLCDASSRARATACYGLSLVYTPPTLRVKRTRRTTGLPVCVCVVCGSGGCRLAVSPLRATLLNVMVPCLANAVELTLGSEALAAVRDLLALLWYHFQTPLHHTRNLGCGP